MRTSRSYLGSEILNTFKNKLYHHKAVVSKKNRRKTLNSRIKKNTDAQKLALKQPSGSSNRRQLKAA